jgi:hypothetical protein
MRHILSVMLLAFLSMVNVSFAANDSKEARIPCAIQATPASISKKATVAQADGLRQCATISGGP